MNGKITRLRILLGLMIATIGVMAGGCNYMNGDYPEDEETVSSNSWGNSNWGATAPIDDAGSGTAGNVEPTTRDINEVRRELMAGEYTIVELMPALAKMNMGFELEAWYIQFLMSDYGTSTGNEISQNNGTAQSNDIAIKFNEFVKECREIGYIDTNILFLECMEGAEAGEANMAGFMAEVERLCILSNEDNVTRVYGSSNIAEYLKLDVVYVNTVMWVRSKNKMTLIGFDEAIKDLNGALYYVDDALMADIEMAKLFADPVEYTKERTKEELSSIFGVDEKIIGSVLLLSAKNTASIEYMVTMLDSTPLIKNNLPDYILESMAVIPYLTQTEEYNKLRTPEEVSQILGVDVSLLEKLGRAKLSIAQLMEIMDYVPKIQEAVEACNTDTYKILIALVYDAKNHKSYTATECTRLLDQAFIGSLENEEVVAQMSNYKVFDENQTALLYDLISFKQAQAGMSDMAISMQELMERVVESYTNPRHKALYNVHRRAQVDICEEALELYGK